MDMKACSNCGKSNTADTNFCRFCGNRLAAQAAQPEPKPQPATQGNPAARRPYSWQTDEFQTNTEARRTAPVGFAQMPPPNTPVIQGTQVPQHFRCPRCGTTYPPKVERRISTGGWITFAVLMVAFFPLFWIGLLIKEDVVQCQGCNLKLN